MCRDGAVVCGLYFFIGSAVVTSTRFCDSVFRDCYALSYSSVHSIPLRFQMCMEVRLASRSPHRDDPAVISASFARLPLLAANPPSPRTTGFSPRFSEATASPLRSTVGMGTGKILNRPTHRAFFFLSPRSRWKGVPSGRSPFPGHTRGCQRRLCSSVAFPLRESGAFEGRDGGRSLSGHPTLKGFSLYTPHRIALWLTASPTLRG